MIEITAEMCIALYNFLQSVDMVCYIADQHPADGVVAYDCVKAGGDTVRVLIGGES